MTDALHQQSDWSRPGFVNASTLGSRTTEESTMPGHYPAYPPEFRRQTIELVRVGRTPVELAREFEPTILKCGVTRQQRLHFCIDEL